MMSLAGKELNLFSVGMAKHEIDFGRRQLGSFCLASILNIFNTATIYIYILL